MSEPTEQPDLPEPSAPQRLVEDLNGLYGAPTGDVPAIVDHAIVARARRQLRRRVAWPGRSLRWAGAGAAAAAAVVAIVLWQHAPEPGPRASQAVANAEDVNRDGTVDIVDAMLLARQVQRGPVDASRDANGDGHVNRADADAIAMTAVSLSKRSIVQ